jgi:hypothetical protein
MEKAMQIRIDPQGGVTCLYGESLDLTAIGPMTIRRLSHVDPDAGGQWWADLSPVQGPLLGPFPRRTEALAAEVAWLENHWLPTSS